MTIENRIKQVMANVFGIVPEQINDNTSVDTLEKWNSLGHMNLVIALEEEFQVAFTDEQIIEMMNYPLVVCIVKEHIAK